jgi:hypothetical protein
MNQDKKYKMGMTFLAVMAVYVVVLVVEVIVKLW